MKHLVAYVFAFIAIVVGLAFIGAALWPVLHSGSASVTLAIIGVGCLVFAACLTIPADVNQALAAGKPLLDRVPMPAAARQTIALRASQAIPVVKDP